MSNDENMAIIKQIPRRDRLEALAEEANELSQSALKLVRAEKLSQNPTPKTEYEAKTSLLEEFYDVLICALSLGINIPGEETLLNNFKVKRWADHIKGAENNNDNV